MNKQITIILLALLVTVQLPGQTDGISDKLKSNIHERQQNGDIIGIVIGTLEGDKVDYFKSGVRSVTTKESVDEQTTFEIGSISKTFTGLMLADMIRHGKMNLDDNIQQYLPVGVKAPMRDGKSIKLLHLANHTSGLPRMPSNFAPTNLLDPFADYTKEKMFEFLNAYELPRDIGSQYEYSNYAMGLLGHILAQEHNKSYEAHLINSIAKPLGMESTNITGSAAKLATGHRTGNEMPHWNFGSLEGAGAIRSTAADMMRYLKANMGLLKSDLYPAMQLAHEQSVAENSNPIVGLGWHVMPYEGEEIIWHNGGTGGFTSFMGWIKGTDKGVVVLNNSTENVDDIGIHALMATFPLKEIKSTVKVDDAILESYVGQYALAPTFILTVTKEGNQLSVQATGQGAFEIYPESETTFFYKVVEAKLVFEKDEGGNVISATLHQAGREIPGKKME